MQYCTQQLAANELVNQFYSVRDLNDNITVYADTNQRLLQVTPTALTSVLTKTTTKQGFPVQVGNMTYYANGSDLIKIDQFGNVSAWGIAAPTVQPSLSTGSFWKSVIQFTQHSMIEDYNGNVEEVTSSAATTGVLQPIWPTVFGTITTDGQISWTNRGPIGQWASAFAYVLGTVILDTNGNLQVVTTAGNSGATVPVWASFGNTTPDNTVVWTNRGRGSNLALSNYNWVYAYRTIYGELSTSSPVSSNTGPILGPQAVNITAFTIPVNAGSITFTGANNFLVNDVFQIEGLSNANYQGVSYLNGQIFTVTSASTTTFSANLTQSEANAASNAGQNTNAPIADSGYTLNAIATLGGEGALLQNGSANPLCSSTATITNIAVLGNIVTAIANNNFVPGLWLTLQTSAAAFLNGQQVQVTSATATQFTFQFVAQNYGPTPETGTATFDAVEIYRPADGGGIPFFVGAIANPQPTTFDSGAVLTGLGTGGSWTDPEDASDVAVDYANVAVPGSSSNALNFARVQSATAAAQFVTGAPTSQGPDGVGTGADNGGGNPWTSPNLITAADGQYATMQIPAVQSSNYLLATNCGFTVPTNSTINGIFVEVLRRNGSIQNNLLDASIKIIHAGTISGTEHASATLWPGTATYASYGSSTDLWGVSWAYSDINASNFGVAIRAKNITTSGGADRLAEVDFVRITVYYTPPNGAPTSATATLGAGVVSGNTLLIAAQGNISSVSVTNGNTPTLLATAGGLKVYAVYGANAGTTAATVNLADTNGGLISISEVSGIATASQVDQSNTTTGSASTGSVTTTNANDAICTFFVANGSGTPSMTIPGGYTSLTSVAIQENGATYALADAFLQVTSTGTSNPTWATNKTPLDGVTIAFRRQAAGSSGVLTTNTYGLNVPPGVVLGIQVTATSFATGTAGAGSLVAQLLRNGQPVGNPKTVVLSGAAATVTFGSNTDLWGIPWNYFNFNNSGFGVQFYATVAGSSGTDTINVNNVRAEVFASVSTWTFVDTTPDSSLVTGLVAPQAHLNDPPPGTLGSTVNQGGTLLAYWNGRVWMAVGNKVYFSGGPDVTNGVPESCFPPAYFFTFPGNVTGLRAMQNGVLVTEADTFWSILGGPQTIAFYPDKFLSHIGILEPNCLAQDSDSIYAYTSGKQCIAIVSGQKGEIGLQIGNIFLNGQSTNSATASLWDPSVTSLTVHRNGYDSGVWLSNGVESCIRYGLNVGNWSTIYQPMLGAVARSGVCTSVETVPGVWTLLLSNSLGGDFIYQRQFGGATGYQDNGNSYDANAVIGNITVAEPGNPMIPLTFVSAYLANVGSVPTVSFLPNEVLAASNVPFTVLPLPQNEPAFLAQSQSIMARRWPVSANQVGTPLLIKHTQVKVDFGSTDTVPNELYLISLRFDREQLS